MNDAALQNKRLIAAGIDVLAAIALGLVFGIAAVVAGFVFDFASGALGRFVPAFLNLLGAVAGLGFILGRDVLVDGRSPGKKVQDLKVVTKTGGPVTFMESARRNAIFAVGSALAVVSALLNLLPCLGAAVTCLMAPLFMLAMAVGLIAAVIEVIKIIQDPAGIRLGDQWAGTRVVKS
jgi:uncharacterized RDD family membrane protein YckC